MVHWSMYIMRLCTKRKTLPISKCKAGGHYGSNLGQNQFQLSTVQEKLLFSLGVLAAITMGCLFPFNIIAYAEIANLIIARHSHNCFISNNFIVQAFGGGNTNCSGTHEDQMNLLLEDALAFISANLLACALQFVFAVISIYSLNYSAQKKVGRMRRHFLKAVLHQDISWHDTQNIGAFASRFTDLDKIQEGTGEKVGMFMYLATSFVASVIAAMFYGWKLTLVMLTICPIFVIVTVQVAKWQTALTIKEAESYGSAGAVAEEVFSNIRTVIAYGGEQKEVERYRKKLAPAKVVGIRSGLFQGLGAGVSWMLVYIAYALAFWYGTPLILADRGKPDMVYTPGVLLIVLFGVVAGATNLVFCSPHLEAFAKARGASKAVMAVLWRRPVIDINAEGIKLSSKLGTIEFKDVHFSYPARPDIKVLKGLSFKVQEGENVALVGSSGSGKSTIIQLLQRFYDPESGSVLVNGLDLKSLDLCWVRRQMGLVGQEPVLFNTSIAKNICCDMKVTEEEMEQVAKQANAHDFITKLPLGYNTLVGQCGTQLSGGQKQRIAVARALLRQPSLLLLDEATSALDTTSEAQVQIALDAASRGRTTITVSHRLSSVRNCHRILVLSAGRLVEEGTHSELMATKGHYYSLVTADASLEEDSKVDNNGATETNGTINHIETEPVITEEDNNAHIKEEAYDVSLRRIIALNNAEWPFVVLGSLAAFINGCISPVIAVLFGYMFWTLSNPNHQEVLSMTNKFVIGFIIVSIVSFICVLLQVSILTLVGVRITSRLRVNVFQAILKQETAWFDDDTHAVGNLCGQLSGDTSAVEGVTGSKLGSLLQGVSSLGVGTALAIAYSWKMTVVCLICVPFILFSLLLEGRVMKSENCIEKKALEDATKVAVEAISAVRTVQSLGQEAAIVERYVNKLAVAEKSVWRKTRFRGIVFALGNTCISISYAFSMYFGCYLIARHDESYLSIMIVSEALLFGAWMLAQLASYAPNFQLAKNAIGRLFRILDRKPQQYPMISTHLENWNAVGDIEYCDVHFSYPQRPGVRVLKGLELRVGSGQKIALVGPSGCGKSTVVQLLQRYYDPVSGTVNINKTDTTLVPLRQLRSEMSIVSQEPVLFDLTIAENIAYGDNCRVVPMTEVIAAAKQANVHSFITSLPAGYDTRLGTRGTQLSGGQRQRIAIARALVRNPKIIILDEATSALDSQSEKMVQEALDEASEGRTCIMIAHRLSTVKNADIICVLSGGVVVEAGTHTELLAQGGHYTKLLQSQQVQ